MIPVLLISTWRRWRSTDNRQSFITPEIIGMG